jgi:hypothetical protein
VIARTTDFAGRTVALKISFPSLYPHNAAPAFEFLQETQLGTESIVALLASMQSLCRRLTSQSQFCLRQVLALLRKSVMSEDLLQAQRTRRASTLVKQSDGSSSTGGVDGVAKMTTESASSSSSSMLKADLPCPRLCGASFAPNGRLVYFSNVGINFSVRTFSKLRETLAGGAAQYIRGSPSLNDGEEPSNVIQPTVTSYNMVNIARCRWSWQPATS